MTSILLSLMFAAQVSAAPPGNVDAGRAKWNAAPGAHPNCTLCHGKQAEGGFAPDLAGGRGLTYPQFVKAIREPWGIMPTFDQTDQDLADLYAYLKSLPPVDRTGPWRTPVQPAGSPRAQQIATAIGCGQCHGPELIHPRRDLGRHAADVDFAWFSRIVYEKGPARMGVFSRDRVPESTLREIFDFIMQEGLRVPLSARIDPGVADGPNATFTLTVWNDGRAGKGLTAKSLTISVVLPAGAKLIASTGAGFAGVSANPRDPSSEVAVWKAAKVGPGEKQVYTLTLAGSMPASGIFRGSSVAWANHGSNRPANLTVRDERVPEKGDIIVAPGLEFFLPPNRTP